jgi:hypothetical protein
MNDFILDEAVCKESAPDLSEDGERIAQTRKPDAEALGIRVDVKTYDGLVQPILR